MRAKTINTIKQVLPPFSVVIARRTMELGKPRPSVSLPKYQRDDYLRRLSFVIPGWLDEGNLSMLDYAIRNMPEGAVVEIGSFAGLSLNHILHMMELAGKSNPVFSVDEWHFKGRFKGDDDEARAIPGSSLRFGDYRKHVIETFRRNLIFFHGNRLPHHIATNSDRFFSLWSKSAQTIDFFDRSVTLGGPIAMAYIDGDHSHEQSKQDFENVHRFLAPGGFVIFDDSADFSEWDSRLTAAEAASRPDYELVAKAPNYCIRKRA